MKSSQKSSVKPSHKSLWIGLGIVFVFAALFAYGLLKTPGVSPSPLVGKMAPRVAEFAPQTQVPSETQTQAQRQNQWLVVNFWSTSCLVCRAEAPELEAFYQATQKQKSQLEVPQLQVSVRFVSVNIRDTNKSIELWKQDLGQTFPVVEDVSGRISLDYGVTGTPETFFIDPKGIVRYRVAGAMTFEQLTKFIPWLEEHPQASWSEATKFLFAS